MIFHRHVAWISAGIGDQRVMMNVETEDYVGLTKVGARIWELIERPLSADDICARLLAEFDVTPDICRAEVDVFLDELRKHGAVTVERDNDGPAARRSHR